MINENKNEIIEDDTQMSNFSQILSMVFVTAIMVFLFFIILFSNLDCQPINNINKRKKVFLCMQAIFFVKLANHSYWLC